MSSISEFRHRYNLDRAWRWIRSNPDPNYKRYCGSLYDRYAIADDLLLDDLARRLQLGIYEPSHACKLLLPKKSGILRPYTLLTVEDQIVYQAFTNVIAERLAPKIRAKYLTEVFGHLYAGRTSPWFYRRWTTGYKAFNNSARAAFSRGLVYTASFDLTACYDSLDHGVLCHFLAKLGCESDFCEFFRQCLHRWTATNQRIYQNHGIPQGPLSSGLISEVVLHHFDLHYKPKTNLAYLRYVDDIRLFASSETDLRRVLIRLDHISKDIGLFPQASKIDIHRVTDITRELKSVSTPTEASIKGTVVNQTLLRKRIETLTPRLNPDVIISDETRFKYLLAHAQPTSRLNKRLLRISTARPDLVPYVARYLKRYQKLPKTVARELLSRVSQGHLYQHVTSEWIEVLDGRLNPSEENRLIKTLKRQWQPRTSQPDLKYVSAKLLVRNGELTVNQIRYALRAVDEWWVRSALVEGLNTQQYGMQYVENLSNEALRDRNGDVSLAAAQKIAQIACAVHRPIRDINPAGGKALRQFGILKRVHGRSCGVEWAFSQLTGISTRIKWRSVFGPRYRQAQTLAIELRALAATNVSAFVNAADVFNDLLLSRLYAHDPTLGGYTLGNIGSVLNSLRLRNGYPRIFDLCSNVHTERLKCLLSHPVVKQTSKPTSRIPYRYLSKAKRLYRAALIEMEARW